MSQLQSVHQGEGASSASFYLFSHHEKVVSCAGLDDVACVQIVKHSEANLSFVILGIKKKNSPASRAGLTCLVLRDSSLQIGLLNHL